MSPLILIFKKGFIANRIIIFIYNVAFFKKKKKKNKVPVLN
jgi:hypothetical protein